MRVFIGLVEVAGYFGRLKRGFEDLGVDVTFVDLSGHPFRYGAAERDDTGGGLLRGIRRVATALVGSNRRLRALHRVLQTLVGLPLLLWGLARYDVFIFSFGSSLLGFYELPILKWFGKTVIHVFCGTDCRPPYLNGTEMVGPDAMSIPACIRAARRRKRSLRRIERHADAIVNHAPQAQFLERPFISWAYVGVPFAAEAAEAAEAAPPGPGRPVRILHSPSNAEIKGTDRIRQAIRSLEARGHAIEYVEISGKPHAVVLEEIARCDFVIDELYSDTYMASFAAEAAFFGKPAIVGGYAAEELQREFPPEVRPPVLYISPDDVEAAAERLVADEAYRKDLGRRAREFVHTRYAPAKVAEVYLRIVRGDVPPEWKYDPATIRHLCGMGMPQDTCRRIVRALIEAGGLEALQLADKPDLQRRMAEFAGLGPA